MVANLNISKITNVTYISDEYAQINGELFSYVCQSILSRPTRTTSISLIHSPSLSSTINMSRPVSNIRPLSAFSPTLRLSHPFSISIPTTFNFYCPLPVCLFQSPSLSSTPRLSLPSPSLSSTPNMSLSVSVSIVHSPFVSSSVRLYRPLPICLFQSPSLSSTPR